MELGLPLEARHRLWASGLLEVRQVSQQHRGVNLDLTLQGLCICRDHAVACKSVSKQGGPERAVGLAILGPVSHAHAGGVVQEFLQVKADTLASPAALWCAREHRGRGSSTWDLDHCWVTRLTSSGDSEVEG